MVTIEYPEIVGFSRNDFVLFFKNLTLFFLCTQAYFEVAKSHKMPHCFHSSAFLTNGVGYRKSDATIGRVKQATVNGVHAVNALFVGMKGVKTALVMNQQKNNQTCADANGQPHHVDGTMQFVPQQIAESDFEMIFQHDLFRF